MQVICVCIFIAFSRHHKRSKAIKSDQKQSSIFSPVLFALNRSAVNFYIAMLYRLYSYCIR